MTKRQSYFCFDRNYSRIVNKVGLLGPSHTTTGSEVVAAISTKKWGREVNKQKNGDQVYRVKLVRERENITSKGKNKQKKRKREKKKLKEKEKEEKKINNFPTKQKSGQKKRTTIYCWNLFIINYSLHLSFFFVLFLPSPYLVYWFIYTY